jgi:thiosulfate/3-mercaptopyruvate sulfurtransferase
MNLLKRPFKNLVLFVWLLLLFTSCLSKKKTEIEKLISVENLHTAFEDGESYLLIGLQDKEEFAGKHIEGAINISRADLESKAYPYGGMVASAQEIEMLFSKLGIKSTDDIVIYDNKGEVDAARLWWILTKYGHKGHISLLDGGLKDWEKHGYLVTNAHTELPAGKYSFEGIPTEKYSAGLNEVKAALADTNVVILDCRSMEENTGQEMKKGATRPGKIPGALWVNYTEALKDADKEELTFKSPELLQKLYADKGLKMDKKIIVYCHSGVRSSHTTFVLTQLLGYKDVKNYAGSWIEWSYFKELPIEETARL